ncbi:MAG: sensor histidine kinase [Oscillospiraceae bacterium]|jgi:two-component system sensor histidine kinase YesM|nr:sensor histidine kinase [Oscillospiraceae bacterium]
MKKSLHRMIIWYSSLKIQAKITFMLILAVGIPLVVLSAVFSNRLYNMVVADTIRNEQIASAGIAPKIADAVQKITNTWQKLSQTKYYQTLFNSTDDFSPHEIAESDDAATFAREALSLTRKGGVRSIRIYLDLPASSPFFAADSSQNLFLPMNRARGTYWYGIFQGSGTQELYCPSFYLGDDEIRQYGDAAYIVAVTLHSHNGEVPGYVAIYYSTDPLKTILSDGITLPGSVSYIIDERQAIVVSTDHSRDAFYRLNYTEIRESLMSSNNFIIRNVLGERIYVGFYYIKAPRWLMVTVLPNRPLLMRANTLLLKFALMCAVCIAAALFTAIWQSRSITSRVSSVIHQMTLAQGGPPVPMAEPAISDEIGELIHTYNHMTDKIKQLMEQQKRTSDDLRIAEFNSLQAQINPHFLYNTMDMINWMAQQGHTADISSAVQDLAHFYKLTLSRKHGLSTVEKEIEHVTIYVRLQNMRYANGINFVADIPDELLECQIPKLTLQPIVENSILHGILEKDSKAGNIVITGWWNGNRVVLLVSDNGVGIPPDKLPTILSAQNTHTGKNGGSNIAVYNVHRRIQLLYGHEYGLSYARREGGGTDCSIHLPMLRNGIERTQT